MSIIWVTPLFRSRAYVLWFLRSYSQGLIDLDLILEMNVIKVLIYPINALTNATVYQRIFQFAVLLPSLRNKKN